MEGKAQGSFEYILMLSGVLLIVIMIVFILQGTVSSANNTVSAQGSTVSSMVDASKYTPGANPAFSPDSPKDGATARELQSVAYVEEKDAALNGLEFSWNSTNYTLYNGSLVLLMNFDNVAALGETTAVPRGSSVYRNNGTVTGATWTSGGKYGGAFSFDGNDVVSVPINYRLSTTRGPSTLEAWIKPFTTADCSIITDNCLEWGFTLSGGNVNGYVFGAVSGGAVLANQWYHIALVHEHPTGLTNTLVKMYVNGELKNTNTLTVASLDAYTDSPLWIGRDGCYTNAGFNGTIDEVRVWNRALSAQEVRMHYMTNLAKLQPKVWRFDSNVSVSSGLNSYQISTLSDKLQRKSTELRTIRGCSLPWPLC